MLAKRSGYIYKYVLPGLLFLLCLVFAISSYKLIVFGTSYSGLTPLIAAVIGGVLFLYMTISKSQKIIDVDITNHVKTVFLFLIIWFLVNISLVLPGIFIGIYSYFYSGRKNYRESILIIIFGIIISYFSNIGS